MHFLQIVAEDLYQRCGGDLRHVTVVFPGRRASVFFNQHLYQAAGGRALWAPRYLSMSDLFQELSPLQINDPIDTVCRLYRHYQASTGDRDTSLDRFYGWGERLLADFDDVDKWVPRDQVRHLFTNLADLKELESLDYLSAEQKMALRDFFRDFSLADNSIVRQRFLTLWRQMYNIYTQLNEELLAEGLAYEGALFRQVVEERLVEKSEGVYVFVGHNALSAVERTLLRQLQHGQRAWFYWDYDTYYTEDSAHEAGVFLRENLREFPNLLPAEHFSNFRQPKDIEFVSAPTENVQARSVPQWLKAHIGADPTRTAIVLASEEMLQPVLHALPEEVRDVNITKGFPLGHTRAYAFVEKFFASQVSGSANLLEVLTTLRQRIEEQAKDCVPAADATASDLMDTEAWYYAYTTIGRFVNLVEGGRLADVSFTTLHKLVRMTLRQLSIPFEGEPVIGLQIMGMLETRCLDFDNVLILSANEKVLPKVGSDSSFIPYFLRRAFGLPVVSHRTAVQAYYFYRLLQRAKHVRCVYNSSTEGVRTGEQSRFMTQLMVESVHRNIRHLTLSSRPNAAPRRPQPVAKTPEMLFSLSSLSPSAINSYIDCPLRFYYNRIKNLRQAQDPADMIAENTFGLLFHSAAELTYKYLSRQLSFPIQTSAIEALLKPGNGMLWQFVCQAFTLQEHPVDFNGVIAEVLEVYLRRMLTYDLKLAKNGPIVVHGLETKHYTKLRLPSGEEISVGGAIDRLDEVTLQGVRTLRVVDYKTGGTPESLSSASNLSPLFTPAERRPHYLLQTFLYCLTQAEAQKPVTAALYFLNHPVTEPHIQVEQKTLSDFSELRDQYVKGLAAVVSEIKDVNVPFVPHTDHCAKCPYTLLCSAQ